MLQNPLTPPYEDSTANSYETDNGIRTATEPVSESPQAMVNTPTSNVSRHESPNMEDQDRPNVSFDEDQDMSDGGAALDMTYSHTEQESPGLAQLHAELYGIEQHMNGFDPENLYGLESEPVSPSPSPPPTLHIESTSQTPAYSSQETPENIIDDTMEVDSIPAVQEDASLPTALSAVSLQLQHLQDGLDYAELDVVVNDQDGTFANNGIQPFPLQFTSPYASVAVPTPPASSAVGVPPPLGVLPAVEYHGNLQSEGHGHTTISNTTISPPIPQDLISFVDLPDNGSDADQDDAEDHYNLSFGEFLYNWGRYGLLSDQQRKHRAPNLTSVNQQRELGPVEPVCRSDLQGELCDIQRINWTDLGVTRREAKQMRMRIYNNYINVRSQHHHLLVS
jgi:hypothetical protein